MIYKNTMASLFIAALSLAAQITKGDDVAVYITLFFVGVSFICNAIESGNNIK